MSNNLGLTSRRFTINHLVPDTYYSFKIRANNPAGSVETQFEIFTTSNLTLKSRLEESGLEQHLGSEGADHLVLQQIQMIVPVVIGILVVVVLVAGLAVCVKRSKFINGYLKKNSFQAFFSLEGSAFKPEYITTEESAYCGDSLGRLDTGKGHFEEQFQHFHQLPGEDELIYASVGPPTAALSGMMFDPAQSQDIHPYATFVLNQDPRPLGVQEAPTLPMSDSKSVSDFPQKNKY